MFSAELTEWFTQNWVGVVLIPLLVYIIKVLNRNSGCIALIKQDLTYIKRDQEEINRAVNHATKGERTLRQVVVDTEIKVARIEGQLNSQ